MIVGARTYEQIALAALDHHWELHRNWLWDKPIGTALHNYTTMRLLFLLMDQLDHQVFHFRANAGRLKFRDDTYLVPDVFVVPHVLTVPLLGHEILEVYSAPLPLVAEVWSPSIDGDELDLCDEKVPIYRWRGDLEIWRINPLDHTLTAWRRRPDDSYTETNHREGAIRPVALPGVTIDLATLFT